MNHAYFTRTIAAAALCVLTAACAEPAADAADGASADTITSGPLAAGNAPPAPCRTPAHLANLPAVIAEASGIAASRTHPGTLWVHNDSEGEPHLYALAADGTLQSQIAVSGVASQTDWEDLAVGPCAAGSCVYIGNIGDNQHSRTDRSILRFPEPAPDADGTATAEELPFRYPDGPSDAEAIFITADTVIYVITKGRNRPAALYRFPRPLRPGVTVTLEHVQDVGPANAQLPDLITGASAAGDVVLVRTYSRLHFFQLGASGLERVYAPLDLTPLGEAQGEGVGGTGDGRILLVSETGPVGRDAAMSLVECTW